MFRHDDGIKCSEKDIVNYASSDSYGNIIKEEDIAVRKFTINFAQGNKSPFDFVKFYTTPNYKSKNQKLYYNPNLDCFFADKNQVSLITPTEFQEHYIRLFVRDPNKFASAEKAFEKFCQEKFGQTPKKGKDFTKKYCT